MKIFTLNRAYPLMKQTALVWVAVPMLLAAGQLSAQDTLKSKFTRCKDANCTEYEMDWGGVEKAGFVLSVSDPDCGCPEDINERPGIMSKESWYWPTRCAKENAGTGRGQSKTATSDFGRKYPWHEYPDGYPGNDIFPKSGQGNKVAFPGWPAVKPPSKSSVWSSSMRANYKRNYCKQPGAYVPEGDGDDHCRSGGEIGDSPTLKEVQKAWPSYYQIHHILEQHHNGRDNCHNLVPMKSKKGDHPHSDYTNFWNDVRLDSEFFPSEIKKQNWEPEDEAKLLKRWKKLMDCKVEVWVPLETACYASE